MPVQWSWCFWLALVTLWTARSLVDAFDLCLPQVVLQQLEGSSDQFNLWTQQLSQQLSMEDQQRLAWNVNFFHKPRSREQLKELQLILSPGEKTISNPLKLWLWISFYWQLRRLHHLDGAENVLYPEFTLTLLQLKPDPLWNSFHIQNMVQSLPPHLGAVARSQWLCLKHARDQLYLLPSRSIQLGANSNCLWRVRLVENAPYWLRLENACGLDDQWFVNLQHTQPFGTYALMSAPMENSSVLCLQNGLGLVFEKKTIELEDSCHWQLNDCSYFKQFISHHTVHPAKT